MSFISDTFNIGKKNMVVGNGLDDFDISSINGKQVKINGAVPGSGGGGIPAIGDIDFIGNLNCNDAVGGGSKGIITAQKKINTGLGGLESTGLIKTTAVADIHSGRNFIFDGQDLYKSYPGIVPAVPDKTYKDYKGLLAATDNITFTGTNKFRNNAVSIQALNTDVPAVFVDKITLNTDGNINCNEINNNTLLKSNSIICENGSPESQKVMARQYHFRPNSLETTGWVFSQKPPEAGAGIAADNYLMLQNTQPTGSLNLVKSSFDPQIPTPFDIVLDPQNGQVKTTTSFDAPAVNFRKNATDAWSIYQPPAGNANENKLIIQNYQDNAGAVQILDNSNNIWADFNNLATSFNKPTFINNTLNVNGNTTLSSTSSLLFGAYAFRPQQYSRTITLTIDGSNDTTNFTNMIFNPRQNTDWTNINTGAINQTLYNAALTGYYKCTATQTALSSASNFNSIKVIFDYVLEFSQQTSPDITPPLTYGYKIKPSGGQPPVIDVDHTNNPIQSQPVFLLFPGQNTGETMEMTIKLTKLDF